jgi:ankyrin repeat protein
MIDAVDQDGSQPLHFACQNCHLETVKLMVSHGANVDAVNNCRYTPLHKAAGGVKDCPELCEILLKHKAKIDAVMATNHCILHV